MSEPTLPAAPASIVDKDGVPRFGTYIGEMPPIDLNALRGTHSEPFPLRLLRRKRWSYALLATPEVMVAVNVADLGHSSIGFVVAVDLLERRVLADDSFLGPPFIGARVGDSPGRGLAADFRTLGASFSMHRPVQAERVALEAHVLGLRANGRTGLRLRAEVLAEGGPPPLGVIAPVPGGRVNITQKSAGMLSFGTLLAGGRTYGLDGGVAGLDYTQGLLARRTAWRWAMAVGRLSDGTLVGINLVEGFNDAQGISENAAWIGGRVLPLGPARFEFRREDPLEPWRVFTLDGALELDFKPIHVHREERDLKLVRSHFVQPFGHFSGVLKRDGSVLKLGRLAGVTEDQDVLW